MTFFAQAIFACFITVVLILWLRRPAERFGLVDHPEGRKRHGETTPLTGGIAITIAFFASLAVSFESLADYRVLLVSLALLALIGILDDLGEVAPRNKLGVQILAAVLMTSWGDHFLVTLGDLFGRGPIELHNWAIPITVFATVAVINSINMFDGSDGLAGGLCVVMLGFFAYFAFMLGDANALKVLVVLIGGILGFLAFNAPFRWRGARTFMGDTGSLVLGFVVVWFAIDLTQQHAAVVTPVTMLWVVGLVLFDLFTVTVRRLIRRRDPAAPDRAHIHHLLLRRGISTGRTFLILLTANAGLAAVGTVGWLCQVPERYMFAGFCALGLLYVALFLFPARFMRMRRRSSAAGRSGQGETG